MCVAILHKYYSKMRQYFIDKRTCGVNFWKKCLNWGDYTPYWMTNCGNVSRVLGPVATVKKPRKNRNCNRFLFFTDGATATATAGPVLIGPVWSGSGLFLGPMDRTFKHYFLYIQMTNRYFE